MPNAAPNSNFTSQQETKKFVTAFAFKVHESLIGMRLASPKRRLLAIFLDLIFISLLTLLNSLWLSVVILLACLNSLRRMHAKEGKTGARVMLSLVAVVAALTIIFQVVIASFWPNENVKVSLDSSAVDKAAVMTTVERLQYRNTRFGDDYELAINSLKKANGDTACEVGEQCGVAFFRALSRDLVGKEYSYEDAAKLYMGVRDYLADNDVLAKSMKGTELAPQLYQQYLDGDTAPIDGDAGSQGSNFSVLAWVQGAMSDLGLSFGWAAVYFSVLTAWWNGQTLGKRILGIKVVRIDGKQIDLWESIGRYGGYSAGLGTGLLGFMQIYWDANRQAIQDKISETLVVRP